ncbi:MAG: DUF4097 domain-containing protein [Myxococcota bacterium]
MSIRRNREDMGPGGFTGFLRSLLAGIPWSETAQGEEELHFDRPPGGMLRLHNANGRTRVIGEDRTEIEMLVSKTARAESDEAADELLEQIVIASHENGEALELEVEMPSKWNRRGWANIELRVPQEINLELSAVNGRVEISGVRGRIKARSSNGSACIAHVVGDIEVATSNAKVCCSGNCGKLVARSSNGKIEIDEHNGSIDASTSNGLIRASLEAVGKHGVTLATSNGRIVLELPDDVDADVDIRVDNGLIRNDRKLCHSVRETNGRLSGRLGSGGALIKLRTSNGSISLR